MTRQNAIDAAANYFDSGAYLTDMRRRVAMPTESQNPEKAPVLMSYLADEMQPYLEAMGFVCEIQPNPIDGYGPFLLAHRIEDPSFATVLSYGHGDVVMGHEGQWDNNLSPWDLTVTEDRWYGRGAADNKGQHTINLASLKQVIDQKNGTLGYNVKVILEMGEECGSPGLGEICEIHKDKLAADVLIASDGPRIKADRPTIFLGSRGAFNFDLQVKLRDGNHHSGNWGNLLSNAGTLIANAIASMVDQNGRILVKGLRPEGPIPPAVKVAVADLEVGGNPGDPDIDPSWSEPTLTAPERVLAWNALEVLAFKTGNPENPANAIPAEASAHLQLRFVVGSRPASEFIQIINDHLKHNGFSMITAKAAGMVLMPATRLDPTNPWVTWAMQSLEKTTNKKPALLPNLGGSIPNAPFSHTLNMPTIWIPHSYAACSQHAPNEHLLPVLAREALQMMAGLWWDLTENADTLIKTTKNTAIKS